MRYERIADLIDRFHDARVLVLGDVMLDRFVYGAAHRISPEAPIPVLAVERTVDMPGGAANVARNISALGGRCVLFGVVGADAAAQALRARLSPSAGVDVRFLADPSRPTTLKTRYVANGQQVMRADWEKTHDLAQEMAAELVAQLSEVVDEAEVIVLSDYAKGMLTDFVIREAINLANKTGKPVILDPKSKNFGRYAGATVLTPNLLELQDASAMTCSDEDQVTRAARSMLERGICSSLVVTRGKEGMAVIEEGGLATHLPTEALQVYDVSGAGDTVVATLALGLAAGGSLLEASVVANAAAGVVVAKRGTATVTPAEILMRVTRGEEHADSSKIYSLEHVLRLVSEWREYGLRVAFTNGCFDLLHPGHVSLLNQARRCADRLVVGLNADTSVRRLKGLQRPVQGEISRATVLAAVKAVDAVVIFEEDTPLELINAIQPDVLVKGADYRVDMVVGSDEVLKRGGRVVLADIVAGHSTTRTVARTSVVSA